VKEKPIIFSSEMIRAILEGRKTQTRRVVKDKHYTRFQIDKGVPHNEPDTILVDIDTKTPIPYLKVSYDEYADRIGGRIRCPYGQVGDWLWGKETWYKDKEGNLWDYALDASESQPSFVRKISPLFMPRWAARIWLEITNVRMERLQDITGEGARAEGIKEDYDPLAIFAFADFWGSLNLKRGYGWDKNPWVFVIEFRKIK